MSDECAACQKGIGELSGLVKGLHEKVDDLGANLVRQDETLYGEIGTPGLVTRQSVTERDVQAIREDVARYHADRSALKRTQITGAVAIAVALITTVAPHVAQALGL